MKIEPFKMFVTEDQIAKVIEIIVKNGYKCTTFSYHECIVFSDSGFNDQKGTPTLGHTNYPHFINTPELTYSEFINKYDK